MKLLSIVLIGLLSILALWANRIYANLQLVAVAASTDQSQETLGITNGVSAIDDIWVLSLSMALVALLASLFALFKSKPQIRLTASLSIWCIAVFGYVLKSLFI